MPGYGPIFGYFDILSSNSDYWSSCNLVNPPTYSIIDIPSSFIVNDYEVFQVIE